MTVVVDPLWSRYASGGRRAPPDRHAICRRGQPAGEVPQVVYVAGSMASWASGEDLGAIAELAVLSGLTPLIPYRCLEGLALEPEALADHLRGLMWTTYMPGGAMWLLEGPEHQVDAIGAHEVEVWGHWDGKVGRYGTGEAWRSLLARRRFEDGPVPDGADWNATRRHLLGQRR